MEYIVQRKDSIIFKNLRVSFMCVSVYTWPLNDMGVNAHRICSWLHVCGSSTLVHSADRDGVTKIPAFKWTHTVHTVLSAA